jgi:hypothetical protein
VEARGKAIRLQHLTPIPQGESLCAILQAVQAELDRAFAAKIDGEGVQATSGSTRLLDPAPAAFPSLLDKSCLTRLVS